MIGRTIGRYRILEKVGEGGMGVVYKAEDTTLKRAVALKFLPVHALDDEEQQARLVREAQAAAALDHININTVYEIAESDGMTYMAMAYVEGESLKQRMKRAPIPVPEALGIIIQVAAGLTRAHAQGVVHRDVKPANVLVTPDGIVKIVDFGLAKLAGATGLTKTDSTIGTAAYMSPEQARSEVVDHRTDIWSVGVILYEMITGRLPFTGEHEAVVIYSILSEDYKPLGEVRTDVPEGIDRIIAKSLAKPVLERYATMGEMLQELRALYVEGMADPTVSIPSRSYVPPAPAPEPPKSRRSVPVLAGIGGGLIVLLAALFLFLRSPGTPDGSAGGSNPADSLAAYGDTAGGWAADSIAMEFGGAPGGMSGGTSGMLALTDSLTDSTLAPDSLGTPALAILYLDNLSGNKDDQYLPAAITEELIRDFSRLTSLRTLTVDHVHPFWGKGTDVREIGNRLGADYVLEGAVLRDKDRLRLNARLLQVSDAKLMWSDRFERTMNELVSVEQDIVRGVTTAIGIAISAEADAALSRRRMTDPRAYEFYARARLLRGQRGKEPNQEAEKLYKRALGVDAEHAPSMVGLAQAYLERYEFDIDRDPKWTTQAVELLARAKPRDSTDADYLIARAEARRRVGDHAGALESARRAAATFPFDHQAQFARARFAWLAAKPKEASQALDSVRALMPTFGSAFILAARISMNAGRTTEAEQNILRALNSAPGDAAVHLAASEFFLRRGRFDQAASEASEALRVDPEFTRAKGQLGICRLYEGKTQDALALLKEASDKTGAPELLFHFASAARLDGKSKDSERALRRAVEADDADLQMDAGALEASYRRLWSRCLLGEITDPTDALAELADRITVAPDPALRNYFIAAVLAAGGKAPEAVEQLRSVIKPGGFSPAFVAADPAFSSLKQNLTFQQLITVK
ncbi:MAG: protein kinase [Candidatus Zixiibacteriota bacterium]